MRSTSLPCPPFSASHTEAHLRVLLTRRSSPAHPPRVVAEAASPPSGRLLLEAEREPIASRFLALKRALNSAYFFVEQILSPTVSMTWWAPK
jgi:hypothetical protein